MIKNLLLKCDYFYKIATSILQPPPAMVDKVANFISYVYKSRVLGLLINKPENELSEGQKTIKKYLLEDNIKPSELKVKDWNLKIDFRNWKYLTDNQKLKKKFEERKSQISDTLTVQFSAMTSDKVAALYSKYHGYMKVFNQNIEVKSINELEKNIYDLESSVKHELMHFAQFYLSEILELNTQKNQVFGLPPKKYQEDEFKSSGKFKDIYKREIPEKELKEILFKPFKKDLMDSIDYEIGIFKIKSSSFVNKNEFAKALCGLPNSFVDSELNSYHEKYVKKNNKLMLDEDRDNKRKELRKLSQPISIFYDLKSGGFNYEYRLAVGYFLRKVNSKILDEGVHHTFIDEEFYTNLQECIDEFINKVNNDKGINPRNLFKTWTGQTYDYYAKRPFDLLIHGNTKKWQLAVKIFYDKVSYLFDRK